MLYRIIEIDGKFQPQMYGFLEKKWWQRVKRDWYPISTNESLWYNSIEEATAVIDKRREGNKTNFKIHRYHANT
jgi:hypothetical protein